MDFFEMDLQYFAEGGAAAAPAGGGDEGSNAADNGLPVAGETLADGTKVDARLAAALETQVKKHPELKDKYAGARGQGQPRQAQQEQPQQAQEQTGEKAQRWEQLKKGEFAEEYGADVQRAVQDRFKNQADATKQLEKLAPMLEILRTRAGVENDDELIKQIMDDDSLYEEEAEKKGMTVEGLKQFKAMEKALAERQAAEKQSLEESRMREHFAKLVQQGEALKARFPDFDLKKELQNPEFLRMTGPDVGVPVEAAYFAIHHNEMMPQAIAYGIQKGVKQVSQTIQAAGRRPAEGAMRGSAAAAAPVTVDPRSLTRKQRDEMVRQARLGRKVTFE